MAIKLAVCIKSIRILKSIIFRKKKIPAIAVIFNLWLLYIEQYLGQNYKKVKVIAMRDDMCIQIVRIVFIWKSIPREHVQL
jgi:hypothetical protein